MGSVPIALSFLHKCCGDHHLTCAIHFAVQLLIFAFNDTANGRFGADLQYLGATFYLEVFNKGDLVTRC
mgnify:CR=1 FL=1